MIDAHMVGEHETGNETYIINLIDGLSKIKDITLGVVISPGIVLPKKIEKLAVDFIPLPSRNNWARLAFYLPSICKKWKADILHTTYIGPLILSCPLVVSVHDVSFKRYPNFFSPRDRLLFSSLLPLTMKKAKRIITISRDAESEIKHFFPFTEKKIDVTYLAGNNDFFTDKKTLKLKEHYGVSSKFILAIGNLQPRKNLLRLIKAFSMVKKNFRDIKLVIAGKEHWKSSQIFELVTSLDLVDEVVFAGYIPNEDLVTFYNLAIVLVYTSLYEGFGLPILEAMACGTPVITSAVSSMPEVAGDAAILVDPYDVEHISEAIRLVLNNQETRQILSSKGLERVKQFSWKITAQQTMKVYKDVLGRGN